MSADAGVESTYTEKYSVGTILYRSLCTIPLPRRRKNLGFS
jgi:hypothetical protein